MLLNVIRSMQFTNNTEIQLSKEGLKYIAEESQFFQGAALFPVEFFHRFSYVSKRHSLAFGMDFTAFSEFFSAIMGNDLTSLKFIYYGEHRPIAFIFTQWDNPSEVTNNDFSFNQTDEDDSAGEITTEYIIRTKNSINPIDFRAIGLNLLSNIKLNASTFTEILHDCDKAEELCIKITSTEIVFKPLGTTHCRTQIIFPSNHKIIEDFVHNEDTKYAYKIACFRSMIKALNISSTVCLETHRDGLLKIQSMGRATEEEGLVFFEFNILPNVQDDEDVE